MVVRNHLKGYKLFFVPSAERELKKIENVDAQKIRKKLDDLVAGKENVDIKALAGQQVPTYRLRVGDFRVIYEVWERVITVAVVEIGHRKEIYRKR